MSYTTYLQRFQAMSHEQREGHVRTLSNNQKRGVVTQDFARALVDAHHGSTPSKRSVDVVAPSVVDPRVLAGTHEVVVEMQRCGGKGQHIRVEHIVKK